ncbi:hypothetical protein FB451DRAFT_1412425 [Mycena latifolia]|nr:hypothetical protein FB451DRAFT_1412425 [Mycena latifolia]
MSALAGSSLKNPWTLDGLGKIVPWSSLGKDKENRQGKLTRRLYFVPPVLIVDSGRRLLIYKGPASSIVPHKRAVPVKESISTPLGHVPALGLMRAEPGICAARNEVNLAPMAKGKRATRPKTKPTRVADPNVTPPRRSTVANNQPTTSSGRTRMRSRASGPSVAGTGKRDEREDPLSKEDLYETAARPPPLSGLGVKDFHKCEICFSVKSHPVSYECGHSDCYVCIRLLLEQQWTCPCLDCQKVMNRPPSRQFAEEASIAHDYPQWVDRSRVAFTCDRLVFPRRRLISVEW